MKTVQRLFKKCWKNIKKALAEGKKLGLLLVKKRRKFYRNKNLTVVYGSRYILKQIALNLYCSLRFFDQNKVDVMRKVLNAVGWGLR